MAKEIKKAEQMDNMEMTLEEAKAFRASLYKPEPRKLSDQEKRESFRLFWAQNRKKYGKSKDLESIIWLHLKAVKMDEPEKFEAGIVHFGLKKLK
jgi:hypothetical protein